MSCRAATDNFFFVAGEAMRRASEQPDDATRYMADNIPVYAVYDVTPEMNIAGQHPGAVYLGLWADPATARRWGYDTDKHGTIWLFEKGLRSIGSDVAAATLKTLLHEMGHALQHDHVLDALEKAQARGLYTSPGSRPAQAGGCGG